MDRRGQVAMFVIVAIVIVAAFAFFFFLGRRPTVARQQDADNPESYIDNCVRDELSDLVDLMISQGGFVEVNDFIMYEGKAVPYLCKNVNYYQECITQYPRYLLRLEDEITREIKDDVEQCFASLEQELARRNYQTSGSNVEIQTALKEGLIELGVIRDFTVQKDDVVRSFDRFDIVLLSPLYNLAYIANEISAQEARNCYFSTDGFMVLYPEYDIRRDSGHDGQTEIYIIKDKNTGKEMTIATRGCVTPAGF